MSKKPIRFLTIVISEKSSVELDKAVDIAIRWCASREKSDETRYQEEFNNYSLHINAFEEKQISFPPISKVMKPNSYMIFLFDSRNSRLYIVMSEYVQTNYGVSKLYDLGSKDTNIINNFSKVNNENNDEFVPISILALAGLNEDINLNE